MHQHGVVADILPVDLDPGVESKGHNSKYLVCRPPQLWGGVKGQTQLHSQMVMLHIKLKGKTHALTW